MSIMKRKKQLLLMSLTALLVIGFGYGIYSVVPQLLAGDTQVADLTLKSQVNDQTIQLTVSDQNQSDTKVVVPLSDNLTYTPTNQTNAGVTYDQVNHQIVIDWLTNHSKMVNLTVKAAQAGTYVFKAQTTRNDAPVNTTPIAATIKPVKNTLTSSVLSDKQTSLSEKVAVPGLQEPDTTSSQSLNTKQAIQQQPSTEELPEHADSDIVTPADLGNQEWLLYSLNKGNSPIDVSAGNVTFGALKKRTELNTNYPWSSEISTTGEIPLGIGYFTGLKEIFIGRGATSAFFLSSLKELDYLVKLKDNLTTFHLEGEHSGPVPEVLSKLTNLQNLDLSNNKFSGNIPESFKNLKNILSMDFSNNQNMYGVIPEDLINRNISIRYTQLTALDPQNKTGSSNVHADEEAFVTSSDPKKLINYVNPIYKNGTGWVDLSLISDTQKIKIFDNLNANLDATDKHVFNLGLGSRTVTTGDTTPLLPGHTYQITDVTGKTVYDGPADPSVTLSPSFKDTQYVIRMDHTQETIKGKYGNNDLIATIVLNVKPGLPKITQDLQAEDSSIGTGNQVKYVKDKPFKMISTLQNDDELDFKVAKMNEKIKATDKDKVSIDPATFEMQKPNTSSWEAIPASDIQENADGYQLNFKDIDLKPKEKIKLRYSVTAKEAFIDTAVLNHQMVLSNTRELPELSSDMTIKNGQLLFNDVPATMSFTDSKIANVRSEIKRKLPDWKMQIEDSRVNKTDWHITANLISELQNSNGDSLGDSVVFKKTGQPNQVINTTSAVDVYDGKAGTTDYQDVQWGADAGPTLSVAPGLAKLGSYTGTMQWTLVDAPA